MQVPIGAYALPIPSVAAWPGATHGRWSPRCRPASYPAPRNRRQRRRGPHAGDAGAARSRPVLARRDRRPGRREHVARDRRVRARQGDQDRRGAARSHGPADRQLHHRRGRRRRAVRVDSRRHDGEGEADAARLHLSARAARRAIPFRARAAAPAEPIGHVQRRRAHRRAQRHGRHREQAAGGAVRRGGDRSRSRSRSRRSPSATRRATSSIGRRPRPAASTIRCRSASGP